MNNLPNSDAHNKNDLFTLAGPARRLSQLIGDFCGSLLDNYPSLDNPLRVYYLEKWLYLNLKGGY